MSSLTLETTLDHEEVVVRQGRRTGLPVIIAIHSTRLGPAVGGMRIARYASPTDALVDCLRLSRGMTYKAAAVRNGTGGGKSVVPLLPGGPQHLDGGLRDGLLLDVAELVHALDGAYYVAPDVGTSSADIQLMRRRTPYVGGYTATDDGLGTTTFGTAAGVEHAMTAAAEHLWGTPQLQGRDVVVIGFGGVGHELTKRLIAQGARVRATDVDPERRLVVKETGAQWVDLDSAYTLEADILAPCALGGVLTSQLLGSLRCRAIVGSANNQLAHDGVAEELAQAGITWAPDFVANAGGVMYASGLELHQLTPAQSLQRLASIRTTTVQVLQESAKEATTTLAIANRIVEDVLAAAGCPQ
ncbi:Glu/Leu/Phe/Val dehydrogenase dimerization domain-containing protein [Streptomyces sp. NPDC005065]|uniref:Glu/Leu/Phe/Val dehydrogenase dimerization domain-containing protein n=1 Tax=Streptomyces sp. NPDC005065 TaxID=3154461 RepID=UPI0033BBE0F9